MYKNLTYLGKETYRGYEDFRNENIELIKGNWMTETTLIRAYLEQRLEDIEEQFEVVEKLLAEEYDKEEDNSDYYYDLEKEGV